MKGRKFAYILLVLAIILIISGGMSFFLIGLKADRRETQRRIVEVNNEFETFSTNTSIFESFRDELYTEHLSNVFFESMFLKDKEIKNKLSNYENLVDELEKNTNKLVALCEDVYYPDSAVNKKCFNYKSIYEQVVNYFVTDINLYNDNIDKFNEYQKLQNSTDLLKKYVTTKKYIDFDKDGKKDGKEE